MDWNPTLIVNYNHFIYKDRKKARGYNNLFSGT
jgi:hypothetical protein